MRSDALALVPAAAFEEDILETKFLWARGFIINHPEGVRRVLRDNAGNYPKSRDLNRMLEPAMGRGILTSEGETWLRHRRLMSGSFDQSSIQGYGAAMVEAASTLADEWALLPPGTMVDVSQAMMTVAARIIVQTMFSSDAEKIGRSLSHSIAAYEVEALPNLLDLLHFPEWLAGMRRRRLSRVLFRRLREQLRQIIAARDRAPAPARDDLLGRLLRPRAAERGLAMSAVEIEDQLVTIFFAGQATTALALTWAWYLLSLHAEARAKLDRELESVLGGRPPTAADVPQLGYATRVIEETLRLYPPIFFIPGRRVVADDVVCGRRIPAGSFVQVIPWTLHRHRHLWDEPDRFDPERFSEARSAGRHRYAYIPFGAGPRSCIGAAFAMTEAVLILATIAQRFRLRLAGPVTARGLLTMRPSQPLRMTLEHMNLGARGAGP